MKEGWTYRRLEDVCSIDYGTRVVQKKDKGSKYYVYGGGGATFMVDSYNREDCFIVSRFAMSPKCTRYVKGKFFLNDSGLSVSTTTPRLSQNFVDKALLANNDTIYSFGKGMAQRNLDIPSFRNLIIPVPPLPEQERIVAELDLLTGIIDKQKAQLKELDTLAQSIFYDMFGDPVENEKGWDVKKLSDIGKVITGNTPSTKDDKNYSSDDYCFVKPSDIAKDGISIISDSEYHISAYGYENSRKLPKGSILTTCIGIIGKVGILSISATCNQQINAIIPKNSLESLYVAYCIIGKRKTLESMANAPVVPIINKGDFSNISIPVPPLSLQQSFAQKIQSIESQKASINRSIAETQKLFDYTMDKYFG